MAPRHSASVGAGVPKHEKPVMCLTENICVLQQLCLGRSCGALVVNSMLVSQQYTSDKVSLNRNTHRTRLYINWRMKINQMLAGT